MWEEWLHHPCLLGVPNTGFQLPSPFNTYRQFKNPNTLQSNLSSRHVVPVRYTQLAKPHSQVLKLPAAQGKTTS